MPERVCRVCGLPTAECNPVTNHLVGGLTINRINPEELKIMANREIAVSTERVYLNKDKTKAVYEGDPEAAFLLVGKGCEIERSVAEAYGIATEDKTSFAIVTPMVEEAYNKAKNVGQTNPEQVICEDVNKTIDPKSLSFGAGVSQQASLLAQGVINQKKADAETTPGVLGAGLEVTHNLQADEIKANESQESNAGAEDQTGQAQAQAPNTRSKTFGGEPTGEPTGDPNDATSKTLEELAQEQNKENEKA